MDCRLLLDQTWPLTCEDKALRAREVAGKMGSALPTCWVHFHAAVGSISMGCLVWDIVFQGMNLKKFILLPKLSDEAYFS